MKLLNFKRDQDTHLGVWTKNGVLDVAQAGKSFKMELPASINDVIAEQETALKVLDMVLNQALKSNDHKLFVDESKLEVLSIVEHPEKIICVGLNYIPHIREASMEIPQFPVLFSKFNNSLAGHKDEIRLPLTAKQFDYEAELVIVIGKEANNVSTDDALSYIFGYSVGNDLSARDLQFKTGQWLLGKSLDKFAPIGPYLVTSDEIDPSNLSISCKVNGEMKQSSNTKNMIFNCAFLISYISQYMTLKPGDIIFTGTPEGVILGYPEDKQRWLKPGDELEVSIEKLGTLRNKLI